MSKGSNRRPRDSRRCTRDQFAARWDDAFAKRAIISLGPGGMKLEFAEQDKRKGKR